MLQRSNKLNSLILTGLLLFSLSGLGCGRSTPTVPDEDQQQEDQVDQNDNDYNNDQPVYPDQPTDPTPVQPTNAITAFVNDTKFPGIWMWEKVEATIQVSNASQAAAYGTLNITFTHKDETVETKQETISLGAGESRTITVKSTKHADNVTVTVAENNSSGGSGYDSNYGQNSGYGGYGGSYSQSGSYSY